MAVLDGKLVINKQKKSVLMEKLREMKFDPIVPEKKVFVFIYLLFRLFFSLS